MTTPSAWRARPLPPLLVGSRRPALGTSAEVIVSGRADLAGCQRICDELLGRLDAVASRFRPDSELSRVNRASAETVVLSPLLGELVRVALEAAEKTQGMVDPTVHQAMVALGYDKDFALLSDAPGPPSSSPGPAPGWRRVALYQDRLTRDPGVMLDLGATAKAWAADQLAARVASRVGGPVLVNLGGDIAWGGEEPAGGWVVGVADDHRAPVAAADQVIRLHAAGLATSSTRIRRWKRGGAWVSHLVDPRTGSSVAGPWRTATVAEASCVEANTASTAALVAGEGAVAWLAGRRLAARLVSNEGTITTVGGWPEQARGSMSAGEARELVAAPAGH